MSYGQRKKHVVSEVLLPVMEKVHFGCLLSKFVQTRIFPKILVPDMFRVIKGKYIVL